MLACRSHKVGILVALWCQGWFKYGWCLKSCVLEGVQSERVRLRHSRAICLNNLPVYNLLTRGGDLWHTFCPAITTLSPIWTPMLASWTLAFSERAGGDWACSAKGRGELGLGKARLSRARSSLATAAASAISKGISSGSGTTSAGQCPFSFCRTRESRVSQRWRYLSQETVEFVGFKKC